MTHSMATAAEIRERQNTKSVVIEATLKGLVRGGSRTFISRQVAEDCRAAGHQISGHDVARYFAASSAFIPFKCGGGIFRWQLVGDIS